MRKLPYFVLSGLLSLGGSLQADDNASLDAQNISQERLQGSESGSEGIFKVSVQADWIGKAKIDKHSFPHNNVKFAQASAEASAIVYYNRACKEGLALGAGYEQVYFSWNHNFRFHRKNFSNLTISATAFTERLEGWLWQAYGAINTDTKYWDLAEYSSYDLFLWGRYEFNCNFNMHAGFLAFTGMKIDRIFPIIGFDWKINDKWKLNAIYPMNMSVVYTYNENWNVAAAIRLFNIRYRVGKHDEESKGLFFYRNNGLELAVNYDNKNITGNVHAGVTYGGQFRVSNKNNKHKHHYNLDAAPYAGGEIAVKF